MTEVEKDERALLVRECICFLYNLMFPNGSGRYGNNAYIWVARQDWPSINTHYIKFSHENIKCHAYLINNLPDGSMLWRGQYDF